jgi:serine/threonine-protein kinase
MSEAKTLQDKLVQFLRKRDYTILKELGQGACGKTVLLHDEQIGEKFVCKKYAPYLEQFREKLFLNFVREIKLLHKIHHQNIVRIFNHYLYPEQHTGFILMEYVDGTNVDEFLARSPEQTNEIFSQAIGGFSYLERKGILHRDIRPANIMVSSEGIVKIIDLGFGKKIQNSKDFKKSISLNWWCEPPNEFDELRYDFRTEIYFVGRLFEKIIQENNISHFKYLEVLGKMCQKSPDGRIQTFSAIETEISSNKFVEIGFTEEELESYRAFAESLSVRITKINQATKYADDIESICAKLGNAYRSCMLEHSVPDVRKLIECFLSGAYYYQSQGHFPTSHLKAFVGLMKSSTEEKNRIILANLCAKLDAIPRYSVPEDADDVPF